MRIQFRSAVYTYSDEQSNLLEDVLLAHRENVTNKS